MADIKFEVVEELGIISKGTNGWTKQLNRVSWNGAAPKYDIRDWNEDRSKCGKGITLTGEELSNIVELFNAEEDEF